MEQQTVRKSSPAAIALAWAIVIVPAAWGLNYTVQNALKLFTASSAPVAPTPVPSSGSH